MEARSGDQPMIKKNNALAMRLYKRALCDADRFFESLVLLLLFSAVGYSQEGNWRLLDQPEYTQSYPSGWSLDQSGKMGTKFILFSGKIDNGFSDNLNLLIQDLNGSGLDLDKYVILSEGQVKTMITN